MDVFWNFIVFKLITANQRCAGLFKSRLDFRPDLILALMPQGTTFTEKPLMNDRQVIWIFRNQLKKKIPRIQPPWLDEVGSPKNKNPMLAINEDSSSSVKSAFESLANYSHHRS